MKTRRCKSGWRAARPKERAGPRYRSLRLEPLEWRQLLTVLGLQPATLSGFVYLDANNDGIFEKHESPISGVAVNLTGTDNLGDSVNISTTTAGNGAYRFTNLRPGTYTLSETQPAGYVNGKDTIGTQGGTTGNGQFSDIVLAAGVDGASNDFGEIRNGVPPGVFYSAQDDVPFTVAHFPIVANVTPTPAATSPATAAPVNLGDTATVGSVWLADYYLAVQPVQPPESGPLRREANRVNSDEAFFGSLSGYVYLDVNDDGVFQDSEPPISGVTITLTGTDDLGDPVSATTRTDVEGYYYFGSLRPGDYALYETQPARYLDGKETLGTLGGASGNNGFSDIRLRPGMHGKNYDFGELLPTILAGYVYSDANDDAIFQDIENPIRDVAIHLSGIDDSGRFVDKSTTPNVPGAYAIQETQPAGYADGKDTLDTQGGAARDDVFAEIARGAGGQGENYHFDQHEPAK